MTGRPKDKHQTPSEIADLFRILKFMSLDPGVTDGDYRLAFRIAQTVSVKTGWGSIGDARLIDEMPRTDKQKIRKFRRRMEIAGWLKINEGKRGRATSYLFLDHNCVAIEERQKADTERREMEFNLRKISHETGLKAKALGVRINPKTDKIANRIRDEISPLIDHPKGGEFSSDKGSGITPLLPQRSTSKTPPPAEDVTQEAPASWLACCECGESATLRNGYDRQLFCEDCASGEFLVIRQPI